MVKFAVFYFRILVIYYFS